MSPGQLVADPEATKVDDTVLKGTPGVLKPKDSLRKETHLHKSSSKSDDDRNRASTFLQAFRRKCKVFLKNFRISQPFRHE